MIEIFTEISPERKKIISAAVDFCFKQKTPKDIVEAVFAYKRALQKEEEQRFVDFYFNLTLIQMKETFENESNSN